MSLIYLKPDVYEELDKAMETLKEIIRLRLVPEELIPSLRATLATFQVSMGNVAPEPKHLLLKSSIEAWRTSQSDGPQGPEAA